MKRIHIALISLLSLTPLFIAGCGGKGSTVKDAAASTVTPTPVSPTPAPTGKWIKVTRGDMQEYVPAVGSFRARQTTQIGPQVSGRVQEMLVDVGDIVKKDQELVRLDPVFFNIEVAQAQARLDSAKAAIIDAELNYTRMKNLWEKPAGQGQASISRKLFDDAKLKFDAATAELKLAESGLNYSRERLKETVIRAPYNAVVSKRLVDIGEPVTSAPTTYLLTIQEVDTLDLEFSLPQAMLSNIEIGTPLKFEVEGIRDGRGSGTIATIFPAIDEATRSFRCRAHIVNPNLKFRPGLLAQVQVLKRQARNTLVLPRQAVTQTATGWEVNVCNNGQPTPKNINVGLISDDRVEILNGLQPNDQVFIRTGS